MRQKFLRQMAALYFLLFVCGKKQGRRKPFCNHPLSYPLCPMKKVGLSWPCNNPRKNLTNLFVTNNVIE